MAEYSFDVDGIPVPQPRTRMARLPNGALRNYDPGTSRGWKELIAYEAKQVRPAAPLPGPLFFHAHFRFPRPASHYRSNGELKPNAPHHVCSRGRNDFDNLAKAPCDVLTQVGFWLDDGQIAEAHIVKTYCKQGERPGASFLIEEL